MRREVIKSYAWGDGQRLVTVYVDFAGAAALAEGSLSAELSPAGDAVELAITAGGVRHALKLAPLAGAVESASASARGDQVLLKLRKREPRSAWLELIKGAAAAFSAAEFAGDDD